MSAGRSLTVEPGRDCTPVPVPNPALHAPQAATPAGLSDAREGTGGVPATPPVPLFTARKENAA